MFLPLVDTFDVEHSVLARHIFEFCDLVFGVHCDEADGALFFLAVKPLDFTFNPMSGSSVEFHNFFDHRTSIHRKFGHEVD